LARDSFETAVRMDMDVSEEELAATLGCDEGHGAVVVCALCGEKKGSYAGLVPSRGEVCNCIPDGVAGPRIGNVDSGVMALEGGEGQDENEMGDNRARTRGEDRRERALDCPDCTLVFTDRGDLFEHYFNEHGASFAHPTFPRRITLVMCSECPMVFASREELDDHLVVHTDVGGQEKQPEDSSLATRTDGREVNVCVRNTEGLSEVSTEDESIGDDLLTSFVLASEDGKRRDSVEGGVVRRMRRTARALERKKPGLWRGRCTKRRLKRQSEYPRRTRKKRETENCAEFTCSIPGAVARNGARALGYRSGMS